MALLSIENKQKAREWVLKIAFFRNLNAAFSRWLLEQAFLNLMMQNKADSIFLVNLWDEIGYFDDIRVLISAIYKILYRLKVVFCEKINFIQQLWGTVLPRFFSYAVTKYLLSILRRKTDSPKRNLVSNLLYVEIWNLKFEIPLNNWQ